MPHILCRSRKTTTTETWTIVWSDDGKAAPDDLPAEQPPADRPPTLPEPPDPNDSKSAS